MSKASPDGKSGHHDPEFFASRVWDELYAELRGLALRRLQGESTPDLMQATALVHEAYLRLADLRMQWKSREHFLAMAATTMRRVLVDQARSLAREKRGDGALRVTLSSKIGKVYDKPVSLLDVDQAMTDLAALDERRAQILEMHYFAGMTYDEIGSALDISPATVKRELRSARAWLVASLETQA